VGSSSHIIIISWWHEPHYYYYLVARATTKELLLGGWLKPVRLHYFEIISQYQFFKFSSLKFYFHFSLVIISLNKTFINQADRL